MVYLTALDNPELLCYVSLHSIQWEHGGLMWQQNPKDTGCRCVPLVGNSEYEYGHNGMNESASRLTIAIAHTVTSETHALIVVGERQLAMTPVRAMWPPAGEAVASRSDKTSLSSWACSLTTLWKWQRRSRLVPCVLWGEMGLNVTFKNITLLKRRGYRDRTHIGCTVRAHWEPQSTMHAPLRLTVKRTTLKMKLQKLKNTSHKLNQCKTHCPNSTMVYVKCDTRPRHVLF